MKDNNYERPEKDNSRGGLDFSEEDLGDYPEVKRESTGGKAADPPPQVLASLKRQRRSRRSLMFVVLLCLALGVLSLAVLAVMKPEVKRPRIIARDTPSGAGGGMPTTSPAAEKEKQGEEASEGRIPEGERGVTSEPTIVIQERGTRRKVFILGEKATPEEEEEARAAEGEGRRLEIERKSEAEVKEEGGPRVAKIEETKLPEVTKPEPPAGRYTVNVGSFREKAGAERLMRQMEEKGYRAFIGKAAVPQKGTWYRVSVGRFSSREEAQTFARALKEKGGMDAFVREFKE